MPKLSLGQCCRLSRHSFVVFHQNFKPHGISDTSYFFQIFTLSYEFHILPFLCTFVPARLFLRGLRACYSTFCVFAWIIMPWPSKPNTVSAGFVKLWCSFQSAHLARPYVLACLSPQAKRSGQSLCAILGCYNARPFITERVALDRACDCADDYIVTVIVIRSIFSNASPLWWYVIVR